MCDDGSQFNVILLVWMFFLVCKNCLKVNRWMNGKT